MIDITMPALSPTMETGTLAKWLVKPGDAVKSGDILAEIETDKATMEVESVDEGTVAELLVSAGQEDIKVGAVIARLAGEGESAAPSPAAVPPPLTAEERMRTPSPSRAGRDGRETAKEGAAPPPEVKGYGAQPGADAELATEERAGPATLPPSAKADGPPPRQAGEGKRIAASPLARRLAAVNGVDLAGLSGSGPHGRIVKADVDGAASAPAVQPAAPAQPAPAGPAEAPRAKPTPAPDIPHEAVKLNNVRKVTARRLTESKQTVPHIYLTVDVLLDPLLKLRGELNAGLEKRGVKLSVNDLLVKALALALLEVPDSNVSYGGDVMYRFSRADISVAVAIPGGLITPVVRDAGAKRLSVIATEVKELAERARAGKLKPEEYTGGTASISNLGMYGIKQFDAVINPPQGMILAVGAGEKRPVVLPSGELGVATVMSATGSFDHRAIDGATAAEFLSAFRRLVEAPLTMLA